MKVTLKYEEHDDRDFHMTLKMTLPQKYVSGNTGELVKLFVNHYNKKHGEANPLDAAVLHIKVAGGEHLDREAKVRDSLASSDECYIMGDDSLPAGGSLQSASKPNTASVATPAAGSPAAEVSSTPAPSSASKGKTVTNEQGQVRCKQFGCNKFFDPTLPPPKCVHHKSPPIFHEVAKWWSCCPDKKAYDWEEFMKIPGCQTGTCSTNPEGKHGQKRFLGGADLRGDAAPVRIDENAPVDPRHKLDELRKGLIAIGVDGAHFERVWAKLASETGDVEKVCEQFRARFAAAMNNSIA